MTKISLVFVLFGSTASVFCTSCAEIRNSNSQDNGDDTDTGTGSSSETGSDSATSGDTDVDTDIDTDADADTDADTATSTGETCEQGEKINVTSLDFFISNWLILVNQTLTDEVLESGTAECGDHYASTSNDPWNSLILELARDDDPPVTVWGFWIDSPSGECTLDDTKYSVVEGTVMYLDPSKPNTTTMQNYTEHSVIQADSGQNLLYELDPPVTTRMFQLLNLNSTNEEPTVVHMYEFVLYTCAN